MSKRRISMGQQIWALLCKNCLKKWRMKRETSLEWLFSFLLILFAYLLSSNLHQINDSPRKSAVDLDLGRVDKFNDSNYVIAFAPESKTTQEIMNRAASAPFMKGRTIIGWPDENSMNELDLNYSVDVVRVIFNDMFSYHLKFSWGYRIPKMREHKDHSAHCQAIANKITCESSVFWEKGFVAFQAAINAAIIEVAVNHSVMDKLMSVTGLNMEILPFIAQGGIATDFFIFFCIISFSSFIYYVSVNVAQERQFIKSLMTMMGLRESAFWLSWGLIYASFILIMAILMALIIKSAQVVILTGFVVVFILFLFYGLSLITLAFLMSVLIKKPFLTGLAIFLLIIFWGSLGFTALYRHLPAFLEWTFCLLSPFAFTAGMAQLIHLDYDVNSNVHLDSSNSSYIIIATLFMLVFDALLYLVLTLYFDKILPNKFGHSHSPWFFLKSSFWFQHQGANHVVLENETPSDPSWDDSFEPVSPEFHGKEAIRINNLKKEFTGKHEKVEALRGLGLDIYEGQITALLGHSGAGKTTLLNILSGLSAPTSGSVTIYNHTLSEMADFEAVSKLTGVCPQSNVQFGFLTVRENLRLFAKIKGILPHEVEQEVQRVLQALEMENIQDTLAQNISGGQKRKLTFGIAILGDPQVLLLDEPTAGLDPLSRHRMWNLLKERKSDRVILFSTQFMDEADILADRKVFISSGRLKCAGSSLFLKKRWGIGYQLSLHLNEMCDPESITSLVKQHIPDAKLTAQSEERLIYILPLETTSKFPDLYRDLDRCSNQGIENYGVSMTTLNEVFLKLEGKSTVDESDIGNWQQLPGDGAKDRGNLVELEQVLTSLYATKKTASGMALWRQQDIALEVDAFGTRNGTEEPFYNGAITVLGDEKDHRFSIACNTKRLNCFPVLMDIISNGLLGIFNSSERIQTDRSTFYEEQMPSEYQYLSGAFFWLPVVACFIPYIAMSSIGDYKRKVHSQLWISGLYPSAYWFGQALVDIPLYFLILLIMQIMDYVFSPEEIIIIIQNLSIQVLCSIGYVSSLVFLTYVISFIFRNGRKNSGLWSFFFLIVTVFSIVANDLNEYAFLGLLFSTILVPPFTMIGSLLIYSEISFDSMDSSEASDSPVLFLALLIDFLFYFYNSIFLVLVVYDTDRTWTGSILDVWTRSGLLKKSEPSQTNFTVDHPLSDQTTYQNVSPSEPPFHVPRERPNFHSYYGKPMTGQKSLCGVLCRERHNFFQPSMPKNLILNLETSDLERFRPTHNLDPRRERLVLYIGSVDNRFRRGRTEFGGHLNPVPKRNGSFCQNRRGEVIGLLGHNGAGKSTTIKMITGDTKPTAGQVILKGSCGGDVPGFLGYCPQENVLWPSLTVREHLEVYAAVKGLKKRDASAIITQLMNAFKLQDQLKGPVNTLSEGIKRKLCFLLSILGNPSVVLLDEPSTGMDPEGQQHMWQAIRATFRNSERGALLTTHYMAEAEAVCDRVAIMVSGRLRCIGSIQHLKSKFGKDYLLEMKVKTPEHVESLHAEILKLFPQAARQERFSSLLVYKLPVEDVQPLSQAFFKLEIVKQSFDLEEYSLSQSTLEQVFLELSKEQELDDFDNELDLSVKWKLLPQEEP
ncbi:Hypothetical predicted protein [Marmota monax]|uniref:ABC transporter domain-containing protein n=1 Tax=Marmota monax TaxID=9995 RepID=A0A5E4BQH3_MARMO|nr:Hypothetical predicted protein [Marmota monax]